MLPKSAQLIVAACVLSTSAFIMTIQHRSIIQQAKDASITNGKYALVWSDEFNGNSVDTTNWNFETGGNGWGNHEQEYYQPANATVSGGYLVVTGKQENVGANRYTSARMTTKGKHEFLYGKIEARIQIPVGQGLWPAFWMLGANIDSTGWPVCGEPDIMEHINADSLLFGTLHWNNNGHVQNGDTIAYTPSAMHVYSIEWDKSSIRWLLDGKQYHEVVIRNNVKNTGAFHQPSFILLNFALGGDWPGQVIDTGKLPARMLVDYVRVYAKK
ncbi:MAG: glycoside hydrolase family 16 protein [Chitinophagaceae bacterium]|nr:glycoside hydrolase family 16 protein [Chitinophagaceae bacterium]